MIICTKCGNEVLEGQEFCPKCGQKVGFATPDSVDSSAMNKFAAGGGKKRRKLKKKVLPIILAAVVIIVIIAAFVFKSPSVESVSVTKKSIELKSGESQVIIYTISPEKASKAKVKWLSSNVTVASVDEYGNITGEGEGSCIVTVTAGKKSAEISVVVKDTINFLTQYGMYKNEDWCEIADNGSWMKLDTNPADVSSDKVSKYYAATLAVDELIDIVDEDLGFKSSVHEKMKKTNALQGRLSESNEDYEVSWTYSPSRGLEILYEVK